MDELDGVREELQRLQGENERREMETRARERSLDKRTRGLLREKKTLEEKTGQLSVIMDQQSKEFHDVSSRLSQKEGLAKKAAKDVEKLRKERDELQRRARGAETEKTETVARLQREIEVERKKSARLFREKEDATRALDTARTALSGPEGLERVKERLEEMRHKQNA